MRRQLINAVKVRTNHAKVLLLLLHGFSTILLASSASRLLLQRCVQSRTRLLQVVDDLVKALVNVFLFPPTRPVRVIVLRERRLSWNGARGSVPLPVLVKGSERLSSLQASSLFARVPMDAVPILCYSPGRSVLRSRHLAVVRR